MIKIQKGEECFIKEFKYYGIIFTFALLTTYFVIVDEVMALSKERYFENENGLGWISIIHDKRRIHGI